MKPGVNSWRFNLRPGGPPEIFKEEHRAPALVPRAMMDASGCTGFIYLEKLKRQQRPPPALTPDVEDPSANIQPVVPIRRRLLRRINPQTRRHRIPRSPRSQLCNQSDRASALGHLAPAKHRWKPVRLVRTLFHPALTIPGKPNNRPFNPRSNATQRMRIAPANGPNEMHLYLLSQSITLNGNSTDVVAPRNPTHPDTSAPNVTRLTSDSALMNRQPPKRLSS